jgi:hypothetical protein
MNSPISFLALPPEIRNQIYSYMTPINGHPRDYAGLFLSCKQARTEMDDECFKPMHHFIDSLEAGWAAMANVPLQIPRPQRYAHMQHFNLEFPRSLATSPAYNIPYFYPLFILHLESLTLDIYDDAAAAGMLAYDHDTTVGPLTSSINWMFRALNHDNSHKPCRLLAPLQISPARNIIVGAGPRLSPETKSWVIFFANASAYREVWETNVEVHLHPHGIRYESLRPRGGVGDFRRDLLALWQVTRLTLWIEGRKRWSIAGEIRFLKELLDN